MIDSRFDLNSFIVGLDKSFIQANMDKLKNTNNPPYIVPPSFAYRMDLISNAIYGTVSMKVFLMIVNDITDLSVVKYGFKMYYPTMKQIIAVMNETQDFIQ
jgi:hypothetical protein